MTFARVWSTGIADNQPAFGAKLTQLDINVSRALDGFAGGKVTPTNPIDIAGQGFRGGDAGDDAKFSIAASKVIGPLLGFGAVGASTTIGLKEIVSIREGALFAVFSGNDKIAQSLDDGRTWSDISANIAAPQTIALSSCASNYVLGVTPVGSTHLVACGNNAKVYYSTDSGVTWNNVTLGGTPTSLTYAYYSAAHDLFVIIGKTAGAPYIATAPGATPNTWTQRTVPGAITGSNDGIRVAETYAGSTPASRFVASWAAQTNVAYSDDGVTWTASTTALTSGAYDIQYGDGEFLAIDTGATNHAYVSGDGSTWTTFGTSKPFSGATQTKQALSVLNGVFVLTDTANSVYYSNSLGSAWYSVSYKDSTFVNISFVRALQKRIHLIINDGGGGNFRDDRSPRIGLSDGSY